MLKRKLRLLQFGVTVLALATMSACGGGDGDDGVAREGPVAEPGSLAECLSPKQIRGNATYTVTQGPVKAIRKERETIGIPEKYDNKDVLRSDRTETWDYSAPSSVAGKTLIVSSTTYYINDDDSFINRVLYTSSVERWEGDKTPVFESEYLLNPPAIIDITTNPPINQPIRVQEKGVVKITENGETSTNSVDRWTEMTYLGQEEVIVPAGRFVACKVSRLDSSDNKTISWTMKNTGIRLKQETNSPTEYSSLVELLEYSVDP